MGKRSKKTKKAAPQPKPHMPKQLKLFVVKGKVLGINVYRGFARLCDLANISQADVFDQNSNPLGTQRDLSPKHARNAYAYIKTRDMAFWPEVFLCVRMNKTVSFRKSAHSDSTGVITIDAAAIRKAKRIAISRVDGNHRLHFAGGNHGGFPAITKEVSFCLAYDLTLEEEIILFRDINDNQRRMNTSHLDNIAARLTPEEQQKRVDPALYIAKKLGRDDRSPFFEKVYEGGTKPGYFMIPLRSLKTGVNYMLSKPTKLTALPDPDAQYKVIRNYFAAVKQWQPEAWSQPNKYLLLRGAGLWAICFVGAEVIDRTLASGKYTIREMLDILNSGESWDWSKEGDFQRLGGRGGAVKIRDRVVAEFADKTGISLRSLARRINLED